ncbi:hypothetical protein O6H91_11G101800 [Diphasiastrum complanatum]|uniref:Uncharacterized protein n=1 Tax=Diphasiastrum complanatum TaxID=34168 RepID=A0ACC2CCK5_DIPCM|nr:hypothetical protein O6H91_11G101800 [Diphasiastrum complanatum]
MESEAQHVASEQDVQKSGVASDSECSPTFSLSPEKHPSSSPSSAKEFQMNKHPGSPQLPTAGEQNPDSSSSAVSGTGLQASDRDIMLAQANQDKVHNYAKAWENLEKTKVINE